MRIYSITIVTEPKNNVRRGESSREEIEWAMNAACTQLEESGFDVTYKLNGGDA